jgi:hypothetical protein
MKRIAITLLLMVAGPAVFALADESCARCGCSDRCRKVCHAVPDTKKVKKTVWAHECRDVCLPGRTETKRCEPTCGRVRTVKALMKKEIVCEEPSWRWVITTLCDDCCRRISEPLKAVTGESASADVETAYNSPQRTSFATAR